MESENSSCDQEIQKEAADRETTKWILSDRDRDAFVQSLLNPPKLSGRLKAAMRRYKEWERASSDSSGSD